MNKIKWHQWINPLFWMNACISILFKIFNYKIPEERKGVIKNDE